MTVFSLKSGFNLIKLCAVTDGKLCSKVLAGNNLNLGVAGTRDVSSSFIFLKRRWLLYGGYSRYRRFLQICRTYHTYVPMVCF